MVSVKSQGAHTGVIIHTCALAGASINAKIVGTLIGYSGFATVASPTRWARTGVRALTGVETGSSIFAWVVICAIIQILVAKKATPTFFTMASPRFITFAMLASRISDTLITKWTFISITTSIGKKKKL